MIENGTFVLDNLNFPFLANMQRKKHGGGNPFPMEVYFINKTIKLDMLWGTIDPILLLGMLVFFIKKVLDYSRTIHINLQYIY